MPGSLRSSSRPARSRPLAALRGQPRESSSVWARGAVAGTALTVGAASLSFGVSFCTVSRMRLSRGNRVTGREMKVIRSRFLTLAS